ncbi:MAG TPA: glycoside hydrolase family 9 protein [Bacteroidota bacterium]
MRISSVLVRISGLLLFLAAASPSCGAQSWVRVNQLGYLPNSLKVAVLLSKDSSIHPSSFSLRHATSRDIVFHSEAISGYGSYGTFCKTFRLDFSKFQSPGSYVLECNGTESPVIRIGTDVYNGTADILLKYMRQQRCGYNPFLNDSCHTHDGYIVYGGGMDLSYIDVVGGWHDAADYLQYVTTSATAVVQMLFAFEKNPAVFRDSVDASGHPGSNGIPDVLDEARWGLEWLLKMNPGRGTMFHQIADDRDHLGFRLPTQDSVSYGKGKERPVYLCTGLPQGVLQYKNRTTGIASIAGKFASAFSLGAMLFDKLDPGFSAKLRERAVDAYEYGKEHAGVCQTAPCRAPYFYEEENWTDDMELAAAQLARLTGESSYVAQGRLFGRSEPVTPWMGADTARHYQWYPFVNLGHYLLAQRSADRTEYLGYMRKGLQKVFEKGKANPFLMGVPFIWCSNNLVSALVTQARLYRESSGDSTLMEMEASARDWLFGCNPWGTSMVVGLPEDGVSPRDPHSAFSHLNNFPVTGGLVDGPVYGSIFKSLKGVTLSKPDAFSAFQSDLAVYHDDWADYSTNEPTMDGTASLIFYLASMESDGTVSRSGAR